MTGRTVSLLAIALILLALSPGCAAPGGGGATPTPTPTQATILPTTAVTTAATTAPSLTPTIPPGEVVLPPMGLDVILQVMKNPNTLHPDITVTFRGGSGQYLLQKLTMTVSRSDGQVIQKVVPRSGENQYSVGDSVTITGTAGVDEAVVVATFLGTDYKIYDQKL